MAKNTINSQGYTQIEQSRRIGKSLGYKVAARYLALRGWSLEAARWILLGV